MRLQADESSEEQAELILTRFHAAAAVLEAHLPSDHGAGLSESH